jgi:hypothetical protein
MSSRDIYPSQCRGCWSMQNREVTIYCRDALSALSV